MRRLGGACAPCGSTCRLRHHTPVHTHPHLLTPNNPHPAPATGHKLPAKWLDSFLMVAQWRFPSFSAKTLSVVAWAVASLGHTPSQEWLLGFEQQVRLRGSCPWYMELGWC